MLVSHSHGLYPGIVNNMCPLNPGNSKSPHDPFLSSVTVGYLELEPISKLLEQDA
jgi:hypothetical protein